MDPSKETKLSTAASEPPKSQFRLVGIELDEVSIARSTPDIDHERAVAIYDLLEANHFIPEGQKPGPYRLYLSVVDKRLVFDIRSEADAQLITHVLSLSPFRKIIADYFLICESYHEAIKTASPRQIEAVDMGRRGVHNEAAQILMDRLEGKITLDFNTARRLFTLVSVLHWKGR